MIAPTQSLGAELTEAANCNSGFRRRPERKPNTQNQFNTGESYLNGT